MKYGILFLIVCCLLAYHALHQGGYYYLLVWPSLSFLLVSISYFFAGPKIYGKRSGRLNICNTLLLFPYLCYLWSVWTLLRLVKKEPAYHRINDRLIIGRRLYSSECPSNIDHVIDLTCEFNECKTLRDKDYHNFQILDGFIPSKSQLHQWIDFCATLEGTIYIHCAEGHGRTGLFTALLLIKLEIANDSESALALIQAQRPLAKIGSRQQEILKNLSVELQQSPDNNS